MKIIIICLVLLFSTGVFAQTTKLIYDNDAATDDAIALVYLANQANISILGITIAGTGEAHGLKGAKNMADLCYMLGKPGIKIAYGREKSLGNLGRPFPDFLRKLMDNLLLGKNIPQHPNPNISDSAVLLMKEIIEKNEKVSILATGPLTNIAEFITTYPHLKNKIEKIVIMGGAVNVKGNIAALDAHTKNKVAEWNIYADPMAAKIVFSSNIAIILVPLDATNQIPLTKVFYEELSGKSQPKIKFVYAVLKDLVDELGEEEFFSTFYLWDSLAAMIVADPNKAITESLPIFMNVKTAHTKRVSKKNAAHSMVGVVTHIPDASLILNQLISGM